MSRFASDLVVDPKDEGSVSARLAALQTQLDGKVDGTNGVKVYRALLTQSGTDAPVATELENSIGSVVWTRGSAGSYIATGVFPVNKTFVLHNVIASPFGVTVAAQQTSGTTVELLTGSLSVDFGSEDASVVLQDDIIGGGNWMYVQILVYP